MIYHEFHDFLMESTPLTLLIHDQIHQGQEGPPIL